MKLANGTYIALKTRTSNMHVSGCVERERKGGMEKERESIKMKGDKTKVEKINNYMIMLV